jgi:hypothetical protein
MRDAAEGDDIMVSIREALRDAGMIAEHPPIPSQTFPCMAQRGPQQVGPDHQRCARCQTIKPLTAFHRNNQARSGRHPRCKMCRSAYDYRDGATHS